MGFAVPGRRQGRWDLADDSLCGERIRDRHQWRISLPITGGISQAVQKKDVDDQRERTTESETESRATDESVRLEARTERRRRIVRLPETKRFAVVGAARTCRSAGRCACPQPREADNRLPEELLRSSIGVRVAAAGGRDARCEGRSMGTVVRHSRPPPEEERGDERRAKTCGDSRCWCADVKLRFSVRSSSTRVRRVSLASLPPCSSLDVKPDSSRKPTLGQVARADRDFVNLYENVIRMCGLRSARLRYT